LKLQNTLDEDSMPWKFSIPNLTSPRRWGNWSRPGQTTVTIPQEQGAKPGPWEQKQHQTTEASAPVPTPTVDAPKESPAKPAPVPPNPPAQPTTPLPPQPPKTNLPPPVDPKDAAEWKDEATKILKWVSFVRWAAGLFIPAKVKVIIDWAISFLKNLTK
jgi:hypothetical protein